MKTTLYISIYALLFLVGCKPHDEHFIGDIHHVNIDIRDIMEDTDFQIVHLSPIMETQNNTEGFLVCDSLAFFFNYVSQHFVDVYNIHTKDKIGEYIQRGHGRNEFATIAPFSLLYKENGELKSLTNAPHENQYFVWNITESIRKGNDSIENSSVQRWRDFYHCPPQILAKFSDSLMVGTTASVRDEKGGLLSCPGIHFINCRSGDYVKTIRPFDNPIANNNSSILPERFFSGSTRVNIDVKKIVTAYYYLPIISVVDLETSKVSGFLLDESLDYSVFETDMKNAQKCFSRITSSDKHIYALWNGKHVSDKSIADGFNTIIILDWDGNLVKVVKTDKNVNNIYYDQFSGILYGCSEKESMLYQANFEKI